MTRLAPAGRTRGDCWWRAAAFVLDTPGATLCVGIFRAATAEERAVEPEASDVPFFHAWCLYRGNVVAPTTYERAGNQLVSMNRDSYYAVNGARDIRCVTRPRLLKISKEIGLARLLMGRQNRTTEPLSERLLRELNYEWMVTDDGGVVPVMENA